jgi:NodT family efflux transporter outer membrane factor (OMF) lipoprotein
MKPGTLVTISAALFLSGCALGPDYERGSSLAEILGLVSGAPNGSSFIAARDQAVAAAQSISHWWERLGDPALSPLVAEMLANNKDLAASAARVLQAQAGLENIAGSRLPSLDLSPSANRSFTTNQSGDRSYVNNFTVGTTLSWQSDLFGRLRRSERSQAANLAAAEADWQGLIHTQIATLVRTRVALATLQRRLDATRAIAESRRATLEAVERRYRAGLERTNAVDLHGARENYTSALADIPSLENDIAVATTSLQVLLGRIPGTTLSDIDTLSNVPPPHDVPVGIPAALLDRRPDLRAAEFRLEAATENVGVAIADLYPNLTLTGTLNSSDSSVGNLFDVTSLAGSLMGQITQPLFDGGARRATVRQREAQVEEQAATYAGNILTAFKEVEDALVAERQSALRLVQLESTLREGRLAEASAFDRFRRGIGAYETLLETQRRLQLSEQTLLIEQQNKWNARIDLLLALGGDWLNTTTLSETDGGTSTKTNTKDIEAHETHS